MKQSFVSALYLRVYCDPSNRSNPGPQSVSPLSSPPLPSQWSHPHMIKIVSALRSMSQTIQQQTKTLINSLQTETLMQFELNTIV